MLDKHDISVQLKHSKMAKVLQKPEPIVIQQITEHLSSIGAIHYTQPALNPG